MGNVQPRRAGIAIFVAALVAVLGVACALALPAQKAYAEVFISDEKVVVAPLEDDNIVTYYYVSFKDENGYLLSDDDVKITELKSSNKKIARADKSYGLCIQYGVTTGSTVISFKANGKPFKINFRVKYTCPVSKFTVAGKSALKTFKKKNIFVTKSTLKNKKVVIKTKKNWVITHVDIYKKNRSIEKDFAKGKRSFSAKISTIEPYDGIRIEFKNKKTDEKQTLKYRKYYDVCYAAAG